LNYRTTKQFHTNGLAANQVNSNMPFFWALLSS